MYLESSSQIGCKKVNQDAIATRVAHPEKGTILALADGISSSDVSDIAAQTAVTQFVDDYLLKPPMWNTSEAATAILANINTKLYQTTQNSEYRDNMDRGYVCTFLAAIVEGTHAHILSIGDCRAYLVNHCIERLTREHRAYDGKSHHLTKALGFKTQCDVDYTKVKVKTGDTLILCTDGLFENLSDNDIFTQVKNKSVGLADHLTTRAIERRHDDDVSVIALRISPQLADEDIAQRGDIDNLGIPGVLSQGETIDGFIIKQVLYCSSRSHVYLVEHSTNKQCCVLKAPSVEMSAHPAHLQRLLQEHWLAAKVSSPHVIKPAPYPETPQALYTLHEFVSGTTLTQWLADCGTPTLEAVRRVIEQVAIGLQALHRHYILHRDIRPENIMIDEHGVAKIIDLGEACMLHGQSGLSLQQDIPGAAIFTAPEYYLGLSGTERSDLYSLATLTYYLLSGQFPYGTSIAKAQSIAAQNKLKYKSLVTDSSTIPIWLDETLKKALHPNPDKRQESLSEFVHDLRHPRKEFSKHQRPLIQRNPLRFWQTLSGVLFVALLYLITQPYLT